MASTGKDKVYLYVPQFFVSFAHSLLTSSFFLLLLSPTFRYGGCSGAKFSIGCKHYFQDVWMFVMPKKKPFGSWIQINAFDSSESCGTTPSQRANHVMTFLRSAVVVFGGSISSIKGSVYETSFAGDT